MKNRKFALTLALEENEELMAEVDALIRERAKAIVREEAEKMLGGSIQEEAKRVSKIAIDKLRESDWRSMVRAAVREDLNLKMDWMNIIRSEAYRFCEVHSRSKAEDAFNSFTRGFVESKLSHLVQADVIKAVTDALTKR